MSINAFALGLLLALLPGLADARADKADKALQASLKMYAQAVRWNDFAAAAEALDPALRAPEGFSEDDEAYYTRFQISGYSLKSGARSGPADYSQRVELRIIDVASQTERVKTDRQIWRYDAAAKRWWLTSGLPRLE